MSQYPQNGNGLATGGSAENVHRECADTAPKQKVSAAGDERPLVVGIGASAGGLESLERLFRNMPVDTGMAFVVIQHLSPDFKSLMDELLARYTPMAIHRA